MTVGDAARVMAFLAVYVLLPGIAAARVLDAGIGDFLSVVAMGGALGMAHLTLTYTVARLAGSDLPWLVAPVVVVAIAIVIIRRGLPSTAITVPRLSHVEVAALVFIALLAQQQRIVYSPESVESSVPTDLLFHAGNAAELRHRFPPEDPRVAGRHLPYHFFSGILPAAGSVVTGVPVGELALAVVPIVVVSWLAFVLAHAGRLFGGAPAAGLAAAGLVLFHVDMASALGLPRDGFLSLLRNAIYQSDSSLMSFAALVSLAAVLGSWPERARPWKTACVLVAIGFWLSGTKSPVIPVVGAGLLAAAAASVARERALAARLFTAAALLGLGAAPFLIWLVTHHDSFAAAQPGVPHLDVFQIVPGASAIRSSAYQALVRSTGIAGRPFTGLLWLIGFLGLGALLGLARLVVELKRGEMRHLWMGTTALVGVLIALLFNAPSLDQIAFAFNGMVLLAVLGGSSVIAAVRGRRRWVAIPLLALAVAPMAAEAGRGAMEGLGTDLDAGLRARSAAAEQYAAGLRFIREHTPPESVIVTRHSALVPSVLAERRSFYASGLFTPEAHALRRLGRGAEPFPDRVALRTRAVALDGAAIADIRRILGDVPLLVIVDAVDVTGEPGLNALVIGRIGPLTDAPPGSSVVYSSDVMRVYRIGDSPANEAIR